MEKLFFKIPATHLRTQISDTVAADRSAYGQEPIGIYMNQFIFNGAWGILRHI